MITLLIGFLLQVSYPHPPQMSFYCAVCPWYDHHLPEPEAIQKRNIKLIRGSEEHKQNMIPMQIEKEIFIVCHDTKADIRFSFSIFLGSWKCKQKKISISFLNLHNSEIVLQLHLPGKSIQNVKFMYLKDCMVWMVNGHFLHQRNQSKLHGPIIQS